MLGMQSMLLIHPVENRVTDRDVVDNRGGSTVLTRMTDRDVCELSSVTEQTVEQNQLTSVE